MPTGYTCDIEKGISFQKFALQCARAFGALISLRDDPQDTSIPDEIKPDDYHQRQTKIAEERFKKTKQMNLKEAREMARKEHEKSVKEHEDAIKKKTELKKHYENMLKQAEQWQPPTSDHVGLKSFMIDQIKQSIDFDCDCGYYERNNPVLRTAKQWKKEMMEMYQNDIKYHKEKYEKELEMCKKLTKWIQDLKKSLIFNGA